MTMLQDPAPVKAQDDAEPASLHGHVLLVEDNPVNQKVTQSMLEILGLDVSVAEDGVAAVEMSLSEAPDLILMDWHMPRMDGVTAIRRIREIERMEQHTQTPIIMFTADTQQENLSVCLQAGANDFLPKPVRLEELRTTLTAVL